MARVKFANGSAFIKKDSNDIYSRLSAYVIHSIWTKKNARVLRDNKQILRKLIGKSYNTFIPKAVLL